MLEEERLAEEQCAATLRVSEHFYGFAARNTRRRDFFCSDWQTYRGPRDRPFAKRDRRFAPLRWFVGYYRQRVQMTTEEKG